MMMRTKMLVCCHKPDPAIRTEEPYLPLQVGKANHPELDLGFATDNTGDNISERNEGWSELTGMYWGWKNVRDVDYLGVCHYRRYFNIDFSRQSVEELLRGKDIIAAKRKRQSASVISRASSITGGRIRIRPRRTRKANGTRSRPARGRSRRITTGPGSARK